MADHDTPPAPVRRRRWPWRVAAVLLLLALLCAALLGGAVRVWRSDAGFDWLVRQVPGLQISGRHGRPDGGAFQAQQLRWQSGGTRVQVDGLAWQGLQWQWRPHPGAWMKVVLDRPRAARVQVHTTPPPDQAARKAPPRDLRLPLELVVRGLQIDTLQFNDVPPVAGIAGDFHLGDQAGTRHHLHRLAFQAQGVQARVQAEVAAVGAMALGARVDAGTLPGAARPLEGHATIGGTVQQPTLDARIDAQRGARLQVRATLAPFAAWPLLAFDATARELDLSALHTGLPLTRLSGSASVQSGGADVPVRVDLQLANAEPGPWNESRLPLHDLRVLLLGRPDQRHVLEFSALDMHLQGRREAGRVQGRGRWSGSTLLLELALAGLRPAEVDSRAAAMRVSGPLRLELQGLPSPDGKAPASGVAAPLSGKLHTELAGSLETRPAKPVRMALDGDFSLGPGSALQARVPQLTLASGPSDASLALDVQRDGQGPWRLRSQGKLQRFNPADWWAGPDSPRWRRGTHSLNGDWTLALTVPASAPGAPGAQGGLRPLAAALRGEVNLVLRDSQLAGVPLQGDASLRAGEQTVALNGTLRAAGNRAELAGELGARPTADRWRVALDAPAVAALGPLFEIVPGGRAVWPRAGTAQVEATASGAWPALRTEGTLVMKKLQSDRWRIEHAQGRWTAATAEPDAPLALQLDAADLQHGERRIESLGVQLDGSLRRHRLAARAASPLRPPAWTDAALAGDAAPPRGGTLVLDATGGWTPDSNAAAPGAGLWRGRIHSLRAAPAGAAAATPWLDTQALDVQVALDERGAVRQASLAPGLVRLLGATLQWSEAEYQAARTSDAAPRTRVDARLDPVPIAPWLARLQPHMGWQGDLRIGGRLQVHSTERLDADLVLERAGGDLSLNSAGVSRALGLTEVRLALAAHAGDWRLTQVLAGRQLGRLSGAQTLRAPPAAAWPPPDSPLRGSLDLAVADLAPWSAWLPAGWRIGGRLGGQAALGGRAGAPEYSGRITGSGLDVSNLLEGVHLKDGELAVALQGTSAQIERLAFKGGDGQGQARITGQASFGEEPQAQLQLVAEKLQALGRIDRRVVLSGDATLRLQAQRVALAGSFRVDEGLVDVSQSDAPKLDDDVTVLNLRDPAGANSEAAAKGPAKSPLGQADVALTVALGEQLRLRGRGLDTLLRGRLRITTPEGRLAVDGAVRTESGTYTAYGQNLAIERGVIVFDGDVATPRLDILAVRPDIDVRVGVAVQGNAVNPRIRLYSEPEMNEMDKLSWLVMGRASEGLGRADTALLQRAALALLAGEGGSPSGGFAKNLGLDEVSVSRAETGEVRDTVVTLGKQLTKRWFVAYERGLSATAGSWQLIYRVARRFTVRAQSGDDSAVDVIWTWRWN